MPPPPRPHLPAGFARVAITGDFNGQTKFANVFGLVVTGYETGTLANWRDICNHIGNAARAHLYQHQSDLVSVTGVEGTLSMGFPLGKHVVVSITGSSGVGGAVHPASTCLVVSWASNAGWRGGKPRSYLTGVRESQMSTVSKLTADARDDARGAADDFMAAVLALTAGDLAVSRFGFISWVHAKEWRTPPIFVDAVEAEVKPVIGTQRRRLREGV